MERHVNGMRWLAWAAPEHRAIGRTAEARDYLRQALEIFQRIDDATRSLRGRRHHPVSPRAHPHGRGQ